jgi:protein-disulfide isomerase
MADEINKDLQDGTAYGVSGTPTFFINGVRLVGAQPLAAFTTVVDQELAAAK